MRNPYVETDEDLDLLTDTGYIMVYPYDYFTSFDKLRKTNYPQKRHFIAISPKVIMRTMSVKGHKGYGNTLV